jgi:hypothetical protein
LHPAKQQGVFIGKNNYKEIPASYIKCKNENGCKCSYSIVPLTDDLKPALKKRLKEI